MKRRTKVLLAEDHPLVLSALRTLVESDHGLKLVRVCTDGLAALSAVEADPLEIAVVDVRMPVLSGLEFLQEVRGRELPVRVVFFTAAMSEAEIYEAVTAGVDGIIFKRSVPETLVDCIHAVAAGERWLSDPLVATAVERQRELRDRMNAILAPLSSREREIAMMAARPFSNKRIADELNISEGTVKVHLHNIYTKLGGADRSTLRSLVAQITS